MKVSDKNNHFLVSEHKRQNYCPEHRTRNKQPWAIGREQSLFWQFLYLREKFAWKSATQMINSTPLMEPVIISSIVSEWILLENNFFGVKQLLQIALPVCPFDVTMCLWNPVYEIWFLYRFTRTFNLHNIHTQSVYTYVNMYTC